MDSTKTIKITLDNIQIAYQKLKRGAHLPLFFNYGVPFEFEAKDVVIANSSRKATIIDGVPAAWNLTYKRSKENFFIREGAVIEVKDYTNMRPLDAFNLRSLDSMNKTINAGNSDVKLLVEGPAVVSVVNGAVSSEFGRFHFKNVLMAHSETNATIGTEGNPSSSNVLADFNVSIDLVGVKRRVSASFNQSTDRVFHSSYSH